MGEGARTAKLDARFGDDERMEGSATQVNIMSSWMAPSASSRREVRILPGEGVGAGLQKRGCGQGAQERATGLLAVIIRATTMAAAVTTPMMAAAVTTRCILKAGAQLVGGEGWVVRGQHQRRVTDEEKFRTDSRL